MCKDFNSHHDKQQDGQEETHTHRNEMRHM